VSGNKGRMQQLQQQQQLLFMSQLGQMNSGFAADKASIDASQEAERQRIQSQVDQEEQQKQAAIKKAAQKPFVRPAVVTSPFGLLSQANTASRTFLS
jgi:hypothetical protein